MIRWFVDMIRAHGGWKNHVIIASPNDEGILIAKRVEDQKMSPWFLPALFIIAHWNAQLVGWIS